MNDDSLLFVAFSVPRAIRFKRLKHLPASAIVRSFALKADNGDSAVYDTLLLPSGEYRRACLHLSAQTPAGTDPSMGDFNPAYSPRDAVEISVAREESDAFATAKEILLKELQKPS